MDVLEEIKRDKNHRVVYIHVEEPLLPELGPKVEEVVKVKELAQALKDRGIERLYRFQAEAIEKIRKGENVFIVAGTGAGKTEAFLIPIIEHAIGAGVTKTASLLIYPTKALARDQLDRIYWYTSRFFGLRASIYDGDVPQSERRRIFEYPPKIMVTNPDMIHFSLQYSDQFKEVIEGTKYIVLDDAHVYNGVFGSHIYYVLRRLKRFITEKPCFVAASATIGNAGEFARKLFGEESNVVYAEPYRKSRVFHALLYPLGRSRSLEVLQLLKTLHKKGLRTIVFADSHRVVESLGILVAKHGIKARVHRAGLLPAERERIEKMLRRGELDAVIATPTLELGIDIGELDAVIMYGIPPTFSKYLQRAGRVGRRGGTAYVFTILGNDPISAYYERNPREFFSQAPDPAYIDVMNEEIAKIHLVAMSVDSPYKPSILSRFEKKVLETLVASGLLKISKRGYVLPTRKGRLYLKERENIRGIGDVVEIISNGKRIGYRELPQAIKELYPGAIYLHGGKIYISLGIRGKRAYVKHVPHKMPPVSTSPLYYTLPEDEKTLARRTVNGIPVEYIELKIKDVVYGYVVKSFPGGETIRQQLLEEELSYGFRTKGVLIHMSPRPDWNEIQNAEAFHAIEHALISAAQMVIGAAPTDMGGISFPSGHIYIYDAFPGGSGLSKLLFEKLEEAMDRAYDIVSRCTCEDGCPRCIFSPYCGNNNQILSRRKAEKVLGDVLTLKIGYRTRRRFGKPLV